jgi:hypothetical protein
VLDDGIDEFTLAHGALLIAELADTYFHVSVVPLLGTNLRDGSTVCIRPITPVRLSDACDPKLSDGVRKKLQQRDRTPKKC